MDKIKRVAAKALKPPIPLTVLLILLSALMLYIVFSGNTEQSLTAYITYMISAYTLSAVVFRITEQCLKIKRRARSLPLVKKIEAYPVGHRFLNDLAFRGTASIYQGLVINLLYSAFRAVTAIMYHSVWFGAIAVYYIILSIIRLTLTHSIRIYEQKPPGLQRNIYAYKAYRTCGILMLLLSIGMAGMIIQMVRDNQHYEYPGFVIYASAAYTFYIAVAATVNLFKFRKLHNPILTASKALTFIGAMMSVMALQTAMLSQFGAEDAVFRQYLNTSTGASVSLTAIGIAVFIIISAGKKLRRT